MRVELANGWTRNVLTLTEPFQERELETELVRHLEKFLLELGQGFAFAGIDKPIGISTYELTRALPARLQSVLPTVEEIEAELAAAIAP